MTIREYQNKELGMGDIPELAAVFEAIKRIIGNDSVTVRYDIVTDEFEVIIPISDDSVYLVADIACRMAILNPQLLGSVCKETDGIILINDVGLHLHSNWQWNILEDVFPQCSVYC